MVSRALEKIAYAMQVCLLLGGTIVAQTLIQVSPSSVSVTMEPTDAPADRTLTIKNVGNSSTTVSLAATIVSSPSAQTASIVDTTRLYSAENLSREFATDHLIIGFKDGATGISALANLSTHVRGMREIATACFPHTTERAHHGRRLSVADLRTNSREGVLQAIAELKKDPNVAYAEPDFIVHANAVPNDPLFPQQYHLSNSGQTGGTPGADISAVNAWDKQTSAAKVVVGVIDAGVDYLHPDLKNNIWTNKGEIPDNGIDDDGNGFVDDVHGWNFVNNSNDPMDDYFHGTHVAGIIAAEGNNGIGVSGVAWQGQIMCLKFLNSSGSGTTSDAINCISYAKAMGAQVLNASWGGGGYDQALSDAIAGCNAVFVASAGNDSRNTDIYPSYPASYPADNLISVASTDNGDALSSFSNFGASSVDLGAPGTSILSTFPRVQTPAMVNYNLPAMYGTISGTSMACPMVSGAAALVLARNPSLTPVQVKQIILNNVDIKASLLGQCVSQGRLNADKALQNTPPSWLTILTPSLTLAAGESKTSTLHMNPAGLISGTWVSNVVVSAEAQSLATVPVSMTVNGNKIINAASSNIDFGPCYIGYASQKRLMLTNTGNSAITVNLINFPNSVYSTTNTMPFRIPAFSSIYLTVRFLPTAATSYNGSMTIVSDAQNAPSLPIALTGSGIPSPHLAVSPTQISGTAAAGSYVNKTLTIANSGQSALQVNLSATTADGTNWIWLDKSSATVNPNTQTQINVRLDATSLLGNAYTGEILVQHNDPAIMSPQRIPVAFTVTGVAKLTLNPSSITMQRQPQIHYFPFTKAVVNRDISGFENSTAFDMDNDGDLDIVACSDNYIGGNSRIVWLENKMNNSANWVAHDIVTTTTAHYMYMDAQPVDIDKDGDIDIVAAVAIPFNAGKIVVFENLGNGTYTEHVVSENVKYAVQVKAIDMDNDGLIDIVSASSSDNKISWFKNNGNWSFTENIITTNAHNVTTFDVGDIDKDGDLDVVSSSWDDSKVAIYRNKGMVFTEEDLQVLPDKGANRVRFCDLDKDGDLDIIATFWGAGIYWYENNGAGVFTSHPVSYDTGHAYYDVIASDVDLDGDYDLIVPEYVGGGKYMLSWRENLGQQQFAPIPHPIGDEYVRGVTLADFNGTGASDIFCGTLLAPTDIPGDVMKFYSNTVVKNAGRIQLVNNGTGPTTVSSLQINNSLFTTNAKLPLTVQAMDSTSVVVVFNPTGIAGASGTMTINSNATDNPNATVGLIGFGVGQGKTFLPGRLQAEDYNEGGEGVGYHDLTPGNSGGAYRQDNVDIQACTDTGDGYNVGWIDAGEWLAYNVDVAQNGRYTITARMASANSGIKTMTVTLDGATIATFTFTDASGWQSWKNVVVPNVNIRAGTHSLRMVMTTGGFNVNYLDFAIQPNIAPVANAGPDITIPLNTAAALDGSRSSDIDNGPNPMTYEWMVFSGPYPLPVITNPKSPTPTITATLTGTYGVQLLVWDGLAYGVDTMMVTVVNKVNQPPVANAGPDQNVAANTLVTLDGRGSTDPDNWPSPLSYSWAQLAGPAVSLTGTNTAQPTFTPTATGTYSFRLTVNDGAAIANDDVAIIVNNPQLIRQPVSSATASSTESSSYPASMAIDGNIGTRWSSSFSDPQWIAFDLGSAKSINTVVFDWETANAKNYVLEGSNDAGFSTKTTLSTQSNMPAFGNHRIDSMSNIAGSYRYYRMYGTMRNTPYGYSIWEARFYTLGTPVTYTLTTNANPAAGGWVTGGGSYNSGETATLSAAANTGYAFANWSGDVTSTANPVAVIMNANKTVTANFIPMNYTVAVTANPAAGGTISGGGSYPAGGKVMLLATPAAGYVFTSWSGDFSGTANPATFFINNNMSVVGNFAPQDGQLTQQPVSSATASSTESSSYPASMAIDGNIGTRWSSSFADPQWIVFDMGTAKSITTIVLDWETANAKNYTLEGSNDASFATKTTLANETNMAVFGNHRVDSLTGITGTYRYYRMYGTARNTAYGYSLWEARLYSGGTPPVSNLLTNGDFSNGLTGWQTLFMEGAAGSITNDAGSAKVAISTLGPNPYDIQIYQDISVIGNKPYTLEFDMKADATPKNFKVVVEHDGGSYTKYLEQQYTVTSTTNTYQHFVVTFTPNTTDTPVKIGFHFGTFNTSSVWMDNVTLR